MKSKRRLLILAGLLLIVSVAVLGIPYPRQLLFGPTIQEIPLCVWQEEFRRSYSGGGPNNSLIAKVLRWLGKGRQELDWRALPGADRDILFASLANDADPEVRKGIALEISYHRNLFSESQIETLLFLLDDRDASVVEPACLFVGSFYDRASPKLMALLAHAAPAHRAAAVRAIAKNDYPLSPTYKETMVVLVRMLGDGDPSVRLAALETPRWSRRRSIQFVIPLLRERLADSDPRCRVAAATGLRLVSGGTKEVLTAYRSALREPDPAVRRSALESMRADKAVCLAAWEDITACALHDKDGSVKAAAVSALPHDGRKAVPLIRVLLRDAACYRSALDAIGHIGPDAKEFVNDVVAAVPAIGNDAFQILGAIKAEEALPFLIKKLNDEQDDSAVLWQAINALVSYGPDAAKAAPRLWKLAENPDKEISRAALVALAQIRADPPRLVPLLLDLFDEEDRGSIDAAATAFGCLAPPHALDAVPALIKALRGSNDFKASVAVIALGNIGPAASTAIPDLLPLLQRSHIQDRHLVGDALAQIGRDGAKVVPALVPLLNESPYASYWRLKAICNIVRFGSDAKAAIPALTTLLDDDDEELAEAAAEALTAIDPVRYPKK